MRAIGHILWGSAMLSLILAAFMSSMIWLAAPLLGIALSFSLLSVTLYRPPDNHLGVIYRFGRFSRWVGPDQWDMIIPWIDEIRQPVSLHLRRTEAVLSDLLTQEQVPVDGSFCVYYQVDLRHVRADFRTQALQTSDEDWRSIIRTELREAANEAIGNMTCQHLLTVEGLRHLKSSLSELLATRLRGFGVLIDLQTGISVQEAKPADAVWRAMLDQLAAVSLGEAALARIRPVLEELGQDNPAAAWEALLLGWASAATRGEAAPSVVLAPVARLGQQQDGQAMVPMAFQLALQGLEEEPTDGR